MVHHNNVHHIFRIKVNNFRIKVKYKSKKMNKKYFRGGHIHIKQLLASTLLICCSLFSSAQPFKADIAAFASMDSIVAPLKGKILLAGSSSFTKWKDINQYFSGYPIINRGFGGSTLLDVIYYAQETIIKYEPKQIIIYCGENDLASSDTVTPAMVLGRFTTLFNLLRHKLNKKTQIAFVSLKPSVSRWHLDNKYVETNKLIKSFLATKPNTIFINVHDAMLTENGTVMKDIFIGDNLHMNAKGYAIWQKIIAPQLLIL